MRLRHPMVLVLAASLVCGACAPPPAISPAATPRPGASTPAEVRTLTIFAAAALTDAFNEIGTAFATTHPGVRVNFNFAGSLALRAQIEEGAAADVFASANLKEMETLAAGGKLAGEARSFAQNRMTIITPHDNPAGLSSPQDLRRPGLKLVLVAEEAPAGMYALQVLDHLEARYGDGFKAAVLSNVVSNEDNVKQVVAKVQLGEADAGIVYASDAVAASDLATIAIPAEVNVVADYPMAVLTQTVDKELARAFVDYVLSLDGQAVLTAWGLRPATP